MLFSLFFQSWQFSSNSVHYLLSLWQKMVGSVPYIRAQDTHLLNTYVPEVREGGKEDLMRWRENG